MMIVRVSDCPSESDLGSIRKSCDVYFIINHQENRRAVPLLSGRLKFGIIMSWFQLNGTLLWEKSDNYEARIAPLQIPHSTSPLVLCAPELALQRKREG